ncbi:MAG TPA: alpha/beta hydrolase [Candidatus Baltobacteraceae bacterium]|nr:alpha/beta hydrolase [Candidatus Baltobacteraceae bacterium]
MSSSKVVALDDGAQTTVETWGSRGPVVLCIHGMTSSRFSWERLAEHLQHRFRVVAYDQRGHGDSAGVHGPMELKRGIRDAENVAAALGEPIDLLVGHSWGGAIAIEAGLRMPVSRVGAIDPMIRQVSPQWYDEYLEELREQFKDRGEARAALVREEYAQWHLTDVDAKVHAVATMTPDPIEGLMRENPASAWDLRSSIEHYDKPLWLAMAALGESINDDATLEEIQARHSSNVEIAVFPGAGHNIHRTAFDAMVKSLDDWMKRT